MINPIKNMIDSVKRYTTRSDKITGIMNNNKRGLASKLGDAVPDFKCPNPDCIKPDIEQHISKGLQKHLDSIGAQYWKPIVYMDSEQKYYCPMCERAYSLDEVLKLTGNKNIFDDDGIDYSRSLDNSVNDILRTNTIIRTFDLSSNSYEKYKPHNKRQKNLNPGYPDKQGKNKINWTRF